MTDELIDDEFIEGPDEMPIEEEIEEVRFWLQRGVEQMQFAMDDFKAYWRGGLGDVVVSSVVVEADGQPIYVAKINREERKYDIDYVDEEAMEMIVTGLDMIRSPENYT